MWKNKKTVLVASLLAVVVLLGVSLGIVFAQDGPGKNSELARVAQILGIDEQKLVDAFKQARMESRAAMLDRLVQEGKLTQEQADQIRAWEAKRPDASPGSEEFKAWMQSKPNIQMPKPDMKMDRPAKPPVPPSPEEWLTQLVKDGKITQEQADQYLAWLKARPDIPLPMPKFPCGPMPGGPPPDAPQAP